MYNCILFINFNILVYSAWYGPMNPAANKSCYKTRLKIDRVVYGIIVQSI